MRPVEKANNKGRNNIQPNIGGNNRVIQSQMKTASIVNAKAVIATVNLLASSLSRVRWSWFI